MSFKQFQSAFINQDYEQLFIFVLRSLINLINYTCSQQKNAPAKTTASNARYDQIQHSDEKIV